MKTNWVVGKRLLSLILAGSMALAMAGCGQGQGQSGAGSSAAGTVSAGTAKANKDIVNGIFYNLPFKAEVTSIDK